MKENTLKQEWNAQILSTMLDSSISIDLPKPGHFLVTEQQRRKTREKEKYTQAKCDSFMVFSSLCVHPCGGQITAPGIIPS